MDVFFRGHGYWQISNYFNEEDPDDPGQPLSFYTHDEPDYVSGVFVLFKYDEIEYRHTGSLDGVVILDPTSTHSDKVLPPENNEHDYGKEEGYFSSIVFKISRRPQPTFVIAKPDKHHQAESKDEVRLSIKETVQPVSIEVSKEIRECKKTLLVYHKGKGLWFDPPSVDSPKRSEARREWIKNFPAPIWRSQSDDEWNKECEKYSENLKEWEEINPLPKYRVVETEIFLEPEDIFELSVPVLHYQPEEACVSAVFKLKANDERQLRYKGQVTVSTLLPCDHPDGDSSGFFFQLDEPYTFTHNDVVLDSFSGEDGNIAPPGVARNNSVGSQVDNEPETKKRRDKQIDFICKTAKKLKYDDLLNIPEGGKAAIKIECLKNTSLFTEDGFKKAWVEAGKRNLISMQDKEKYL